MTEYQLLGWLTSLDDPSIVKIYEIANAICIKSADTLSDEFQLAASVAKLFMERFEGKWLGAGSVRPAS